MSGERVTTEQVREMRVGNVWEWDGDEITVDALHDDLALDLLDSRAEVERLRGELEAERVEHKHTKDHLAMVAQGIHHASYCSRNIAAGGDGSDDARCIRCERDDYSAELDALRNDPVTKAAVTAAEATARCRAMHERCVADPSEAREDACWSCEQEAWEKVDAYRAAVAAKGRGEATPREPAKHRCVQCGFEIGSPGLCGECSCEEDSE